MEKIIDIINFYKNIKSKFELDDIISHIKVIYHKIWNGPDLYFYNNYNNNLVYLNDTNPSDVSEEEIIKLASFLPREIENYSRRVEVNDKTVLFCYFNISLHQNGFLFTIIPKESLEQVEHFENIFYSISSFLTTQSYQFNSQQYDHLNKFILELQEICSSSFNLDEVIKNILVFLQKFFKNFNHSLVLLLNNQFVKYHFNDTNFIKETMEIEKKLLNESEEKEFIHKSEHNTIFFLKDKDSFFGYIELKSQYLNYWTDNILTYYKILKNILSQAFSRILLYEEVEKESGALKDLMLFRKDITAMIAHDLSSPLMGIMGYLSIIRMSPVNLPNSINDYIHKSYRLSSRLNKLVEDFRLINQLDSGKIDFNFASTPIKIFLEESIKFYTDLYAVKVNLEINDGIEIISVDAHYFSRIIENLLNNSIKYVGENVEITISLSKHDEDNFVILFSDNGPGIPENDLPYIFDKFKRASSKLKVYGSGLGLFICKVVTELHSGSISVYNAESGGAVFKIIFPAKNSGKKEITNFEIE